MSESERLRDALRRIAEITRSAAGSSGDDDGYEESEAALVCTPKALPKELQVRAAQTAADVNPVNAPAFHFYLPAEDEAFASLVSDPARIAVLTSKYWGPSRRRLTVSFMETTGADLRAKIISHLNAWNCGIQFVETRGTGQVRISREPGGYWSYLGTDVLHIATNRPTMNLEGFTMSTSDAEFRRVVRHEGGHTLGFPHEHMRSALVARIDREKAYAYFFRTQGWNRTMVDQQVLTPLDERSIMGTRADETSIMCYQLPGEITRDGRPIVGGLNINTTDVTFAQRIYPPTGAAPEQREQEGRREPDAALLEQEGFVYDPVPVD
jgi:hypothetical protein